MAVCVGKKKWTLVTITHSKSSHKINIPVEIARGTGMDKAEMAIVSMREDNKFEVKRFDKNEDIKEYFQENQHVYNRSA